MALRIFSTSHNINKKKYLCLVRGVVSALHIPGHLSKAAVSILTPDLSDIDKLITEDLVLLQKNLSARNSSFCLNSFIQQWNHMTELRLQRELLETRRLEVTRMMKQVVSTADNTSPIKIEEIKQEGIRLRTLLKQLTKVWWDVEEIAVTRALSLPNSLHSETPIYDSIELYSFIFPRSDHCPHSSKQNIKFVNHSPTAFYLRGLCAQLEIFWMRTFSKDWIDKGYNLISPPDFVRSLVVDGCGLDFNNPKKVLSLATIPEHGSIEKGNGFHLIGGSSLPAIVAFLTKNVIQDPYPLRLVSAGRTYHPPTEPLKEENEDLTNTLQASSIHLLTVMKNCPDAMFQEVVSIQETISRQLQNLNVKFRIIAVPASHLERWEQYRSSIEIFSSSSKKFIEVAYVSIIGDYISRRLSIYGPDKESPGFVAAQSLSVPKLLSCYLKY